MPNKGENSKSVEARMRKAAAAEQKREEDERRREDEKWKDEDKSTTAKANRKQNANEKSEEKMKRKNENRRLAEEEENAIISNKKVQNAPPKLTQHQIFQRQLLAAQASSTPSQPSVIQDEPLMENPNQLRRQALEEAERRGEDLYAASDISSAVAAITGATATTDMHPEKRVKAAYKAYEEEWLPRMKAENPSLKRSQLLLKIRKQFQSAPENPLNQQ